MWFTYKIIHSCGSLFGYGKKKCYKTGNKSDFLHYQSRDKKNITCKQTLIIEKDIVSLFLYKKKLGINLVS